MSDSNDEVIRYIDTGEKIDYGRTPILNIEGGKTPGKTDVSTVAQLPTPPRDGSGTKPIPKNQSGGK
jgi:hypothetical protein